MSERIGFDRILESWLDSETRAAPDKLHPDLMERIGISRQRPAWLARALSHEVASGLRIGARYVTLATQIAIAVLLLALALAFALAFAGSRTRLPAPFGPAANGAMIFDRGGDIQLVDMATGREQALVAGAADDKSPQWSRDGTKFAFVRMADGGGGYVMAANADGRGVRPLSAQPLQGLDGFSWTPSLDWSPDGTGLAVYHKTDSRGTISILSDDGRPTTTLDLGNVEPWGFVGWRPPTGSELIFVGHPDPIRTDLAVFGVRPDGTGLRQIAMKGNESPGRPGSDPNPIQYSYQDMVLSDDGSRAVFWNWEPTVLSGRETSVHVLDLDSGEDQRMTYDGAAGGEMAPALSPNGDRVAYEAGYAGTPDEAQLMVVPLDGGRAARLVGAPFAWRLGHAYRFSPDGTMILLYLDGGPIRLIDVSTGASVDTVQTLPGIPDWQRRTP